MVKNALGTHTTVSRVQGAKLKAKREIRIASLFKDAPPEFLNMIVVHELAHLRERDHDKAFYQLCTYMEPGYHQLEFEVRVYLTHLERSGERLWATKSVESSPCAPNYVTHIPITSPPAKPQKCWGCLSARYSSGWKTAAWKPGKPRGSHRRITRASVDSALRVRDAALLLEQEQAKLNILVVEDDINLLRLYQANVAGWPFGVHLYVAPNGYEALVMMGEVKPTC